MELSTNYTCREIQQPEVRSKVISDLYARSQYPNEYIGIYIAEIRRLARRAETEPISVLQHVRVSSPPKPLKNHLAFYTSPITTLDQLEKTSSNPDIRSSESDVPQTKLIKTLSQEIPSQNHVNRQNFQSPTERRIRNVPLLQ